MGSYKNLAGAAGARFLTVTALQATWSQAIVYSMQLLTSNMIARLIFTTLPGAGLRFLIEKLIKG